VILNTAEEKDLLTEQDIGPAVEAGGRIQLEPSSLILLRVVMTVPNRRSGDQKIQS
jgi:hypothetical protein